MSFPLLTATAALPAIGAIATAAVPAARRTAAKWLALLFSLGTLVLAAVVFLRFEPGGDRYQLTESRPGSPTSASGTNWASTASGWRSSASPRC